MFGHQLGGARDLHPAAGHPGAVLLYVLGVRAWRESWVAVIGVTLVFFWLLMAVTAPFLPLLDPNKPMAPFALPGTTRATSPSGWAPTSRAATCSRAPSGAASG